MKDDDAMSADDFFADEIFADEMFGDGTKDKSPRRAGRRRAKESQKDILGDIKARMVMRIYGVPKARALAIIAGRAGEREALGAAKGGGDLLGDEESKGEFMSAEDFFGVSK
ncbi:MAG: hypothetical protein IKF72_14615 [Kiritimatiellae bacterium]|nr:hypothetical protein [Kiritimatiellia bacterium]